MNNTIFNLFPTTVMICEQKYKLSNKEIEYIKNIEQEKNHGGGENYKSVSSDILENKELNNLKKFFNYEVQNYMYNHLNIKKNIEFYITQSWSNYNNKNERHHKHSHPNSIVSGVFYIQGYAPIRFHRADQIFPLDFQVENYKIENATTWLFGTKPNDLILFPSKLEHSVLPNEKDETRISIAFNTFIKGTIGEEKNLTELNIKDKIKELDFYHI
jgi:hypothetical protein